MGKEYKTLINKALERFYFSFKCIRRSHAERAAHKLIDQSNPKSV